MQAAQVGNNAKLLSRRDSRGAVQAHAQLRNLRFQDVLCLGRQSDAVEVKARCGCTDIEMNENRRSLVCDERDRSSDHTWKSGGGFGYLHVFGSDTRHDLTASESGETRFTFNKAFR